MQEGEERQRELLDAQIRRAKAAAEEEGAVEGTELQRDEDGTPLHIALKAQPKVASQEPRAAFSSAKGFSADDEVRDMTWGPSEGHLVFTTHK